MEIKLETKNKQEEILLKYLEDNASESLIDKINNGIKIEKNGKSLVSKKDLKGFMSYATNEARKLAEKGANSAMVEDGVVFSWLIHYFEEDGIEGTLFNLDRTPYQEPKKTMVKTTTPTTIKKVEKKPEPQFSLFDMFTNNEEPIIENKEENNNISSEEEIEEITTELEKQEIQETQVGEQPKISGFYLKYQEIQNKYPNAVVMYRLGDFYEVLGENANNIANSLELTLTGRDCGLKERVPMVGFPYHCVEKYILQIHKLQDLVVVENENKIEFLPKKLTNTVRESQKHWIDEYTYVNEDGVMHETSKPSVEIPKFLLDVFANKITAR